MSKYIYLASLLIAGLGFYDHGLSAAEKQKSSKLAFTSDEEGGATEENVPQEPQEAAPEVAPKAAPEVAPKAVPEKPPVPAPEEGPPEEQHEVAPEPAHVTEAAPEDVPEAAPEDVPEAAPEATPVPAPAPEPEVTPADAPAEAPAPEIPSLSEVVQGAAQANEAAEEAAVQEGKTLDNLRDLMQQAGENPTPEQKTQISKAANSFLSAATQSAQAEVKSAAAQEKVVTTRIRNNVSSNTPTEPGF